MKRKKMMQLVALETRRPYLRRHHVPADEGVIEEIVNQPQAYKWMRIPQGMNVSSSNFIRLILPLVTCHPIFIFNGGLNKRFCPSVCLSVYPYAGVEQCEILHLEYCDCRVCQYAKHYH